MQPAHNLLYNQIKAGLGSVDPDQISTKITEVSKDTKFFQKQKERSKIIDHQIDDLKLKLQFASKSDLHLAKVQVDSYISSLEKKRDINQVIFHADLDAFFASVEVINDPSLEGTAFAVGGSIKHGVVSTSSYEARKFGVRSGMAIFIALSLCPQLRIVSPSGRYAEFSEKVQSEFSYYDPNYISFGLDEASMNMTEYLKNTTQTAVEVAKEIQEKVFKKTKLTISIGIGPTNQLAKIASDINKPNGVFEIPRDVEGILNFIQSLPVRKIPGVGGVTERKLQELNFIKMGDILERRSEVWFLFSKSFCKFIFSSALGIQYSSINKDERKSISKEETFEATNDLDLLLDKVERMAEKLALKLQRNSLRCKTVTVKFKTHDFQIITQQITLKQDSSKISDISGAAVKILMDEHNSKHYKLRLIGVRVSNLVDRSEKIQTAICDWIGPKSQTSSGMVNMSENQDWGKDENDDDNETMENDFSIQNDFQERSNGSDFQFESENQNQLEINTNEEKKSDPLKFSIDRYFQKRNDDFNNPSSYFLSECETRNEIQFENDNIKPEKNNIHDFSIKKYFQVGNNEIHYDFSETKDKQHEQDNQKKNKKDTTEYPIKKYFKAGYNANEKENSINIEVEGKTQRDNQIVTKKKMKVDTTKYPINNYFQKNKFDEQNEDIFRSESESQFDESSEDDNYFIKEKKQISNLNIIVPQINNSANTNKQKKKKIIEKYFPESMWESEKRKLNQLPKKAINLPQIKPKTKVGTFTIGSFFDKTPSIPE